jgi:hypothetical protein
MRQLPECLPYFQSHYSLVLLAPMGLQSLQDFLASRQFVVIRGRVATSLLEVFVVVVGVGVVGAASGCQTLEESSLLDCRILASSMWVTRRAKMELAVTVVTEEARPAQPWERCLNWTDGLGDVCS